MLDGKLREGEVTLGDGPVSVDGKTVAWKDVALVSTGRQETMPAAAGVVWSHDSQRWPADILGVSGRKLSLRLPRIGERQMAVADVASIEFVAGAATAKARAEGTLFRRDGEPLPGTLLSIDVKELSIDSLLGVLKLPRDGCLRYDWPAEASSDPPPMDTVVLTDRSVWRGRVRPVKDGLELEHSQFGKIAMPAADVVYVARSDRGFTLLGEIAPKSVQATSALGLFNTPATFARLRPSSPSSSNEPLAWGLRIEPTTTAVYGAVPYRRTLRARLQMSADSRGAAVVRISAGGQVLLSQELQPAARPLSVSVDVPAGQETSIEVDYGVRPEFPCAVVFAEPVLTGSALTPGPSPASREREEGRGEK